MSVRTDSNIEHFCEECDYGRNPNKEDCDHSRTPIKTQKHDIFVRTAHHGRSSINKSHWHEYHVPLLKLGLTNLARKEL